MSKATATEAWPSYPIGPHDTVFVLGVVALVYNRLEIAFRSLFSAVTETPTQLTRLLFPKIQNDVRLDLVRQMLAARPLDPAIVVRVDHFCRAFRICSDNRHSLMHAHNYGGYARERYMDDNIPMILSKYARSGEVLACVVTIDDLKRVADDMQLYTNFALSVSANVPRAFDLPHTEPREDGSRQDWPLPETPPLPFQLQFEVRGALGRKHMQA